MLSPRPLVGEGDFQDEQKSANTRKSGRGEYSQRTSLNPLSNLLMFEKVFSNIANLSLPQGARLIGIYLSPLNNDKEESMLLGVNIDHIATLRNARGGVEPDLVESALICERVGVAGITTHLREDRRHIKDEDVIKLKGILKTRLNLEMAMTDEMLEIALKLKPAACCIVPEKRQELTTEGGLDVASQLERAVKFVKPLEDAGIAVSLFIDPNKEQVLAASKTGAQFIELHTGAYSEAFGTEDEEKEFLKLKESTIYAQSLGLKVNAGHGLNYQNVHRIHEIPELVELNIGHSIISRAIFIGLEDAVREMLQIIR